MLTVFALFIGCQLAGEILRMACSLPLPGPVVGMFLLTTLLIIRDAHGNDSTRQTQKAETPDDIDRLANGLVGHMGLLFVPAGVGVITEFPILQLEWLPVLLGVIISTLLSLVVTGWVMHCVSRTTEPDRACSKS